MLQKSSIAVIFKLSFFLISSCRKLPRALKDWQAFLDLKKTIDDFNESCPLLELMANKAMKQRHWDRIAGLTGHTFDMESETFSLRNIMEAPLLKSKEDIEVRAPLSYPYDSILLAAILKKTFIQSVTQAARKKDPSFRNRSETYDLLVTSPVLYH